MNSINKIKNRKRLVESEKGSDIFGSDLDVLAKFRMAAFEAFGPRVEYSDAVWFPTWSGRSVGGRLARVILGDSKLGVFFLLLRVVFETFVQGAVRCRTVQFFLPKNWISDETTAVLQTWRDFQLDVANTPAFQDKFFGDYFVKSPSGQKISYVDIIVDNVPEFVTYPNLLFGRSERIRFFYFPTILQTTKTLFENFDNSIKMIGAVPGLVQKIACLVVLFGMANQRSRNAYSFYEFLAANLTPVLSSNRNPPILYLPYEVQPEQNALVSAWREGGGKAVGYIHSTMLTFPAHYLRPLSGAVDFVWCHGSAYPDVLVKLLRWSDTQVKQIASLRYAKRSAASQEPNPGSVYFPYWPGNLSFAISQIEKAAKLDILSVKSLKPHPATGLSKKDRNRFEKIMNETSLRQPRVLAQVIAIGPVSVPLEELERGSDFEIIHVPISDAPWDSFSLEIWSPYLSVEPIFPGIHVFRLKLKSRGAFINIVD
jgi:hypothetical protein